MGRQMIKRIANGHLVWDEEKKKSLLISNYEAIRHDKEQGTTEEPAADKAKEKPKQKNTKTETKKEEATDGE